jgi:hypothetical protein
MRNRALRLLNMRFRFVSFRENQGGARKGVNDKDEVVARLRELGVFVQDYESYTAKQLDDILWAIKSMPRGGRRAAIVGFAA